MMSTTRHSGYFLVNVLALRPSGPGFAMLLFYWVATIDVKRYPINDISVSQIDIRMSYGHSAYRK